MGRRTVVIGLNTGHDGGAAVVIDGKIACAISEERINRTRYSSGYLNSFFYCLNALNLQASDLSLIVFSSYHDVLPKNYQGELKSLGISPKKFISVDHHLSHAYGAFYLSPFEDALIAVIDGQGNNNDTESYYIGEGQKIIKIGGNDPQRNPAKGIGRTYEAFTNFLGWTDQYAGKTMGLAAYKDSSTIEIPLFDIKDTQIFSALDYKYEKGVLDFIKKNNLDFGEPFQMGQTEKSKIAASYVQHETEKIILTLIKKLVEKTGKRKLCLSGGVALNSSINGKLIQEKIVDDIFILPASSDRGQPIGNALYGFHYLTGFLPKNPLRNDYFGRKYSEEEIENVLKRKSNYYVKKVVPRYEIEYSKEKNICESVASLIAQGKIVGWFQEGSELGPRALGHRSILADARNPQMKNMLNKKVKHRESFRPFAPSCLLEKVTSYFKCQIPSPYMLLVVPTLEEKITQIPAVVHVDNTARVQTVTKNDNGKFYDLIKAFYNKTGVPMILNTSFNRQEPIVETPADALCTFLSTNIDYLAIENYLVKKI